MQTNGSALDFTSFENHMENGESRPVSSLASTADQHSREVWFSHRSSPQHVYFADSFMSIVKAEQTTV